MNFENMFIMQGMLFALMLIGLLLKRTGLITDGNRGLLSGLVVNVTLPCSIIKSFEMEFDMEILRSCLAILLVALAIQVGAYILSLVLYPGLEPRHKKVLQYATICSNAGILGNPIAEGIYGALGLLYASIYLIPQRIFMWSLGLTYFTECPDKKTLAKRVATHPCIIAAVVGLILMISQRKLPPVVNDTVLSLANANTAVSMLFIGSVLAGVPFKSLWNKLTVYYGVIRLFFIPFLVWAGCSLFHLDPTVLAVSVVLAGMPAASTTAILADRYDCDAVFSAKCVVSTTLLSMITVPLWCLFLG